MANKPRPSLLDLFDPLLADAVRTPIPESPPMTPQKTREQGVDNKENLAPNELTMTAFFNRMSRKTYSPTMKVPSLPSGLLVDLEDAAVWSEGDKTQASPRGPLTELSMDDFALPSTISLNHGSTLQRSMSQSCSPFSGTMSLPPSPLRQAQLAPSPLPAISSNESCHFEDSLMHTTHHSTDSVIPQTPEPQGESSSTSPSQRLLHPDNHSNSGKRFRRRSSIDISTAVSSLSPSSFHMQDASFDLVNGEISFLTKCSEEYDVDHDVQGDSWEPQTPRASPQTRISEGSPLDLSTIKQPSDEILLTNTATQPSIANADTYSESQLAHSQLSLPSSCTGSSGGEELPTLALNPVEMEGQDTPPSTRRASSVPAPMKRLRVFTSKHHQTAYTVAKRTSAGVVAAGISSLTSKISPRESAVGCGISSNSGIPRGNTAKGAVIGDTVEQQKEKFAASGVKSNMKAPSRTVRSLEISVLHKEEVAERSLRTGTHSRVPGPTGGRGATVANQGRYGRPEWTQRGCSIPVRSKLRSGP